MQRVGLWLLRAAFWIGALSFALVLLVLIASLLMKIGLIREWNFSAPDHMGAYTIAGIAMFFGALALASRFRCSGCAKTALVYQGSDGESVTQPWRFNCAHCGEVI